MEYIRCHLCGANANQPVLLEGRPLTIGQFGYEIHPVICQCSLVLLNPRWQKKEYDHFNETNYDTLYRLETKPDYGIEGVVNFMAECWRRISSHIDVGKLQNVLDIGCSYGHGLKYIKEQRREIKVFGIESSPNCQLERLGIGAKIISTDYESNWHDEYEGKFDLIIMRHVVEHMLDPVKTVLNIKKTISKEGVIYISLPDMLHPRMQLRDYKKWWEYWFRPVHPYYYNVYTLFATLKNSGLFPEVYGQENNEIWCIVSSDKRKSQVLSKENVYELQIKVLNSRLKLF